MVDEVITIPELQETLVANGTDMAVVRQAGLDKKIALSTIKTYIASPASLSVAGVVQLNNATNSTSITQAATPSAVKITFDLATVANQTATSAFNGLAGKANLNHTHAASDIVSGIISTARLPVANSGVHGIVRPTESLSNPVGDSANGYVPSLPLISSINNVVNSHTNTFNTLASNGTYNRWDGGTAGLNAYSGRYALGASAVGSNLFTTPRAASITSFPRVNPDDSITYRNATELRSDLGIGGSSESTQGLVSEASQAEVNAGSAVAKYVNPSKLKNGVSYSPASGITFGSVQNGYSQRWGSVYVGGAQTVNISDLFPNACRWVSANLTTTAPNDQRSPQCRPNGRGISIRNPDSTATTFFYVCGGD